MPETKKRKPRTNYERLVRDTAQYCRISIRVLKDRLPADGAGNIGTDAEYCGNLQGQIVAYETVLRELGQEQGGSE